MKTRQELYERGVKRMLLFCKRNCIEPPDLRPEHDVRKWRFGKTCAYYRPHYIHICIPACATPGTAGRQWSWPGYVTDRTPYGVLQHELGHAVDMFMSKEKDRYRGDFSASFRLRVTQYNEDKPITGYAPDDGEWFAEIFRLFVTNPDLLDNMRPWTHGFLREMFKPATSNYWREELNANETPPRYYAAAQNKIS